MTIEERLAALERRLRTVIDQRIANVVHVAPLSVSSDSGKGEGLDGRPARESSQRSVRRIQHAGFRSRPKQGTTCVALAVEGGSTKLVVIAEDDESDVIVADGETKVYAPGKVTAYLHVDANGTIKLTNASGVSVQLDQAGAVDITTPAAKAVNVTTGAAGSINLTAGVGGSIILKGNAAGGALNVARVTDTAGPYPITGGNLFVKA